MTKPLAQPDYDYLVRLINSTVSTRGITSQHSKLRKREMERALRLLNKVEQLKPTGESHDDKGSS